MIVEKVNDLDSWMANCAAISDRRSDDEYYTNNYGALGKYTYFKIKEKDKTYIMYGLTFKKGEYWIIKEGIDLGVDNRSKIKSHPTLDDLIKLEGILLSTGSLK